MGIRAHLNILKHVLRFLQSAPLNACPDRLPQGALTCNYTAEADSAEGGAAFAELHTGCDHSPGRALQAGADPRAGGRSRFLSYLRLHWSPAHSGRSWSLQ